MCPRALTSYSTKLGSPLLPFRDEAIRQLRQKAAVLERAKAAAERRLTNDLAAERRAAAALKQQMKAMHVSSWVQAFAC